MLPHALHHSVRSDAAKDIICRLYGAEFTRALDDPKVQCCAENLQATSDCLKIVWADLRQPSLGFRIRVTCTVVQYRGNKNLV
mmetsp:Transcript_6677/g.25002  ORF Transcript_6677/g.25002 Transcript_6677/m.25002 type:complete len:83 (-) Transcript_6677:37-285(-)